MIGWFVPVVVALALITGLTWFLITQNPHALSDYHRQRSDHRLPLCSGPGNTHLYHGRDGKRG